MTARAVPLLPLALAVLAACSDSGGPRQIPAGLTLVPVDSGYDFSLFVTAPPGDPSRLLVVERGGRILLRKDGVKQDSAFLNLTALTGPATGEYGVYSLAFHPGYAVNRKLYVYHVTLNGDSQVSEFTADPGLDHADPGTLRPILSQAQDADALHYGGTIAFGNDGKLYLALGDGSGATVPGTSAQDSASLLGKMLRIDVDAGNPYAIPADNPYVSRPGWRPEIWQLGLRNPWRWSFDRVTGDLWIGDVGENLWEEISHLPGPVAGGSNFGWPFREGTRCFSPPTGCPSAGLTPPIIEYPHGPACSVTGGYVYRGAQFPDLQGTYFYGDYCSGLVHPVRLVGGQPVDVYNPLAPPLLNDNVVSFGEDATGEVYVVMASGRIYRLALAGG